MTSLLEVNVSSYEMKRYELYFTTVSTGLSSDTLSTYLGHTNTNCCGETFLKFDSK
jgi:hypothetical protein